MNKESDYIMLRYAVGFITNSIPSENCSQTECINWLTKLIEDKWKFDPSFEKEVDRWLSKMIFKNHFNEDDIKDTARYFFIRGFNNATSTMHDDRTGRNK